ncbi:MAG: 1-deoxy-D-xylulose-5-phosphate reductoisomerase [Bacteroidota bacterium]
MLPASLSAVHTTGRVSIAPRGIALLGATGSIGTQALDIVRLFPDRLRVRALTAGSNAELLAAQAEEFRPALVVIGDEAAAPGLHRRLGPLGIDVLTGDEGLCEAARVDGADLVLTAVVGSCGLRPTLAAIEAGKTIALANKETLVVGGALVAAAAKRNGVAILPVDSEHSAIFQCLVGEPPDSVERLTLTASGGPFRMRPAHTFSAITRAEALNHPNWSMGAKVTIDSATLMNKGLEVIEARWLFDLGPEQIDVLVHPQSIIHSMVTFADGSAKAQLGVPTMKVPIQYALTYPDRWPAPHPRLDWTTLRRLDFELPDTERFPCLRLAFEALDAGGTAPCALNAANEVAVASFLRDEIGFTDIPRIVSDVLDYNAGQPHASQTHPHVDTLVAADAQARQRAQELRRAVAL